MCDPITIIEDIGLTLIGQPELIPIANAATAAIEGKGLKGALLAGGEALLGQEVSGAFGFGEGNSLFNNALGINDTPAGFGLPDLGQAASNAIGGVKDTFSSVFGGDTATSAAPANIGGGAADSLSSTSIGGTPTAATGATSVPTSGGTVSTSNLGLEASNQIGSTLSPGGLDGTSTSLPTHLGTLDFGGSSGPSLPGSGGSVSDLFSSAAEGLKPDAAGLPDVSSAISNIASNGSPTAGASSGGFLSGLKDALPSARTAISAAAPIGELAYTALKGPTPPSAEAQALGLHGAATQPLLDTEKQSLEAYNAGRVSPSAQALISQEIQKQQNALIQQLSSSGVTNIKNDSRYIQGMNNIRNNALVMMQSALEQELRAGTSAAGAASNNLSLAAQESLKSDTEFQSALNNAFGSLGLILAGASAQPRAA